ncbi:ABC transporter permease [Enterococcus diestrammenae]|uniref:ABC transmembrane type-1 domain-containing protein n=1 Tax=Enterococcus diestrammenae TaxID=1155073 RepID=A0ABV0EXF1_9ENTE|nr:ABC transporter permease subunit [Enterococcus diestrammenae]KAF1295895.1 protein lplB [Enterococcus diestrammenae]
MENVGLERVPKKAKKKRNVWKAIKEQKLLILMVVPLVIWLIVFCYVPLGGWIMAFQDYKPASGILGSAFVGLKHFKALFQDDLFYSSLINTLGMGSLGIIFGTGSSILFALLLNELRFTRFKKFTQTVSYLPHFVSWVIVANIVTTMLSTNGVVNQLLMAIHLISEPIQFMSDPSKFWFIVTFADVWKEMGWNAIIYLAAMVSIDREMYEAADIDGATRLQKMWSITLPSIRPIIMVLLIMSIGNLINIGFEKQMLLGNNIVADKALVLDKYALDYGIGMFRYSYGTAIGIFKSVVSVILIFTFNKIASKTGEGQLM